MYDENSQFFEQCMIACYNGYEGFKSEDKSALWKDFGKLAKNRLNNRRHNVVRAMKDRYLGKFVSAIY